MGDEVKKVEKHWFMICKQQQNIEANILVLPMQETTKQTNEDWCAVTVYA